MNENTAMMNKEELRRNSMCEPEQEKKVCEYCGKPYKEFFLGFANRISLTPDCDCAVNMRKRERQKEKGKEIIDEIRDMKVNSGIGKRYFKKTFSNYDKSTNSKAVNECLTYCKNFLKNLKEGKGLFLTGTVGTGKTHLLAAIIDYMARLYKRKIIRVMYFTSTGLLNEIRNSYSNDTSEEFIDRVKRCSLLLIDDFGAEKTTDWVLETYFEIIDYRYSNLLPTIIATNLTDKEIKEKLSERIMSRIYEANKGIKLIGKDYRLEGK